MNLQIFRNGNLDKPSDYQGPREAAGIVSYVEKASGPASKELKSAEEVRAAVVLPEVSLRSLLLLEELMVFLSETIVSRSTQLIMFDAPRLS